MNQTENRKNRVRMLQRCLKEPEYREYILEKCRRDPIFWTNNFAYTLDPRVVPKNLPLILYPKQEQIYRKLDELLERSRNGEEVAIFFDKPRDVGLTVTTMNWILHKFLFDDSFNALIGSRKEDYVDKTGNPDTLFYKIDYTLDRLPSWMRNFRKGEKVFKYDKKDHRSNMSIRHPFNGNTIDGESSNSNFGRGGRRSVIIMDELDFWEEARSSWTSCGESTNFRIAITTPSEAGRDSFCYKLKNQMEGRIEIFELNWTDVPTRDKEWLQKKKESRSEEAFAREIMKSYEGTVEGKVYAADMRSAKIEPCIYNPELPLYVVMDDGLDATAIIWLQKDFSTGQIFAIDSYQKENKEISFFAPFFGYPMDSKFEYDEYDKKKILEHKYWQRAIFFGDPSIKQRRNNTGKSCWDVLNENFGIDIQSNDWSDSAKGKRVWKDLRDMTKPTFRRLSLDPVKCEKVIYALRNARYPKIKEGSNTTQSPQKPVHDKSTSHFRSAYEYFCDHEEDLTPYFNDMEETYIEEEFDKFSCF